MIELIVVQLLQDKQKMIFQNRNQLKGNLQLLKNPKVDNNELSKDKAKNK